MAIDTARKSAAMKQATKKDEDGKLSEVLIPDSAPQSHAQYGILLGPPSLAGLGLPKEVEVRLHNELFHRKVLTLRDAKARRTDLQGALQAALRLDIEKIIQVYEEANEWEDESTRRG